WKYYFDTQFAVGAAGATAISRVVLAPNPIGLPPPPPASVSQTTKSEVTPTGLSTISVTNTGSTYQDTTSAVAEWDVTGFSTPVVSGSCTADTSSSIRVTVSGTCTGIAFAMTSQSYSTCTSSL